MLAWKSLVYALWTIVDNTGYKAVESYVKARDRLDSSKVTVLVSLSIGYQTAQFEACNLDGYLRLANLFIKSSFLFDTAICNSTSCRNHIDKKICYPNIFNFF